YHIFQLLTKRPVRMRGYFNNEDLRRRIDRLGAVNRPTLTHDGRKIPPTLIRQWPMPTLWLGVSVENQHFADERIPLLLETPSAVRFISAEPLLEEVDLTPHLYGDTLAAPGPSGFRQGPRLDWVIVGGESGPGARAFDLTWGRSLIAQCREAGVA